MRKILCNRRAVSPLLATIILIAITVSAGLAVYSLFFSTAGTLSSQLSIQPSVDIVKTSTTTLVSATIKNSGNKPINTCTVTVYGDSGTATLTIIPIDPGQSKSTSQANPSGFTVTIGKSYPATIVATATDGSTIDKTITVVCMG
jgi:flagellin-like protein